MSSKKFTKKVFAWLRQVKADHGLPPSGALFALQLIVHFNEQKGGACWASCKTMADSIGKHETTVVRLYHLFEQRGHLKVEWGKQGSGHSNRSWMIVKKPAPAQVLKPAPAQRKPAPAQVNLSKNHLSAPKGAPKMERERALRARPIDGAGGSNAAAPSEEKKEPTRQKKDQEIVERDAFAELAALWQRPHADDHREARRPFVEACQHAEPGTIIAGARVWVAAYADEPEYLPVLAKWLATRCWEKTPKRQRRKNNRDRSLGDAMREAGERKATNKRDVIHYK